MFKRNGYWVLAATLALAACGDDDDDGGQPGADSGSSGPQDGGTGGQLDGGSGVPGPDTGFFPDGGGPDSGVQEPSSLFGVTVYTSTRSVQVSIDEIEAAAGANDALSVAARVDHAANAQGQGGLTPTQLIVFGNPSLGTPLMQEDPVVGLDLPQKLLAWQADDGTVRVALNSVDYLAARHGLENSDAALETIAGALENLARRATGLDPLVPIGEPSEFPDDIGNGILERISNGSVEDTYAALRRAVDGAPQLRIIAEIDHQANAAAINETLVPSRLLIFGNPALGTPLMRSARSIGMDLPQKMLVYQDATGGTAIAWNSPEFLAARHGIEDEDEVLAQIGNALSALAEAAAADF